MGAGELERLGRRYLGRQSPLNMECCGLPQLRMPPGILPGGYYPPFSYFLLLNIPKSPKTPPASVRIETRTCAVAVTVYSIRSKVGICVKEKREE